MSHLDELDEYEAERELRVRREYEDVFPLFRYCVLTQDGTYLCNKLTVDKLEVDGRPCFELELEDAWIWDVHRPRRLIERVQITTAGDLTVETIRGEEGESLLTPEDVAERRRRSDDHLR